MFRADAAPPKTHATDRPSDRRLISADQPKDGGGGASRCAVQLRVVSTYLRIYDLFNLLNVGIMLSGEKATSNTKTALPPESLQRSAAASVCVYSMCVCTQRLSSNTDPQYVHTRTRAPAHTRTHT